MCKQIGEIRQLVDDILLKRRSNIKSSELANIIGKQHKIVLRDIRIELTRKVLEDEDINAKEMFILSKEHDIQNQKGPIYIINSDGILHLLCRYGRYIYKIRKVLMEKGIHI